MKALDDTLNLITTIIKTKYDSGITSQGTGFFYNEVKDLKRVNDETVEFTINKIFLVTNKHVVLNQSNNNEVPNVLTFRIRFNNIHGENFIYKDLFIDKNYIKNNIRFHKKSEVDIAIIDISELIFEIAKTNNDLRWSAITKNDFPNIENEIEVADSIITIGYPKGFFDEYNQFPIIKGGIISSKWLYKFNNQDNFLIESKLFPGSSGSLVITKPSNIYIKNSIPVHNSIKKFYFLGIYSSQVEEIQLIDVGFGNTFEHRENFNIGIVWYYYLIEEIINDGEK